MNALDTLDAARAARASGNIDSCTSLAAVAEVSALGDGDHVTAYHAAAAPGRARMHRGEPQMALGHYRHALDVALTHGVMRWLPAAYHDLYEAALSAGLPDARSRWGATAFELYRDSAPRNPYLSGLIADFASEEMEADPTQDRTAFALQAWRAVPASVGSPRVTLVASANAAYAAAALGLRCRYDRAMDQLGETREHLPDEEALALALLRAAEAGTVAMDFLRAHALATDAACVAERRGENLLRQQAEILADHANAERLL